MIRSKTKSTYPIGWQEQPLYHCEMIQRFMRVALMHYNLSKDKHKITSSFKEIKDLSSYIKKKFPNISNIHAYKATLGKRSVIFLGIIDSNNSVYCTAIYLGKNISKLRPVRDIHELLQILTIKEREDSIEVLSKEVLSYYEFQDFINKGLKRSISEWLQRKNISKPSSLTEFLDVAFSTLLTKDRMYEINNFLEGITTPRPFDPHGFLCDLEKRYRSRNLTPIPLYTLKLPIDKITHLTTDKQNIYLRQGDDSIFYIHPTSIKILQKIQPELIKKIKKETLFYPTLGSRSGYIQTDGVWSKFQIKMDLFRIMGGWYRLCGLNGGMEETEVAAFFLKNWKKGNNPPSTLIILPTTEAVVYTVKENLHIATLARPIPESLQNEILIPAAFLYGKGPFGNKTFLEELLKNKTPKEKEEFFINILLYPSMKTWEYFLSLEDKNMNEWGYAFEMHGLNYYHIYDKEKNTVKNRIVVKDFASNRILYNSPEKVEKSQEWIIDQYDVSFGHLHLKPLIEEMARITDKPTTYYNDIVIQSFIENISPKNKSKFLINGKVIGTHRDVYKQLEYFYAPRERTWVDKPCFRPVNPTDYLR